MRPAFIALLATLSAGPAHADEVTNARDIVRRVLDRDNGSSEVSLIRISTCRYAKKGRALACADTPRDKLLQQFTKDVGEKGEDTKGLSIILEPVAEKGIGFLQFDYDDESKDSDQWIFLSALGKVKRIASGGRDQPKTGSFFGTEVTFEDMEARKLQNYTYSVLQSENYKGRACWVVESVPVEAQRKRTSYGKVWEWIDKERDLVLKRIQFDRNGRKVKRMAFKEVSQIDGVWVVGRMEVNNLVASRISTITTEARKLNVPIDDDFLTQRSLTDRVFREKLLSQHRDVVGR